MLSLPPLAAIELVLVEDRRSFLSVFLDDL